MKIIILAFVLLMLQGCLYHNQCGFSKFYWDEKDSHYDAQGNYVETCPENIIYREDAPRGQSQNGF